MDGKDSCVVDANINTAPLLCCNSNHSLDLSAMSDITLNERGLSALFDNTVDGLLAIVGGASCDNHLGTRLGEDFRDSLSDTLTRSGHNDDAPTEIHFHVTHCLINNDDRFQLWLKLRTGPSWRSVLRLPLH